MVHALLAEFLDVGSHREEDGGRSGGRIEAERETQLPVEVAAAQRGVVAIRQPEARREPVSERAQDARLADAGLASDEVHPRAVILAVRDGVMASWTGRASPTRKCGPQEHQALAPST